MDRCCQVLLYYINKELSERIEKIHTGIADLEKAVERLNGFIDEVKHPMIYDYVDENMPEWAREPIQKLRDNGVLKGDKDGRLGLTDEMLRLLVVIERIRICE